MDVDCAAEQIISAIRRGDAEIVLTLPAKIAVAVNGVLPGLIARLKRSEPHAA